MFFVESPLDEYGNRAYTNSDVCVIEANVIETEPGAPQLQIVAPEVIKGEWPIIRFFPYQWITCDGPARMITRQERDEIIAFVTSNNS